MSRSRLVILLMLFTLLIILLTISPELQRKSPIPISIDEEDEEIIIGISSHNDININDNDNTIIDINNDDDDAFLTETLLGYKNYTEFQKGHLPLIISVPHGGHLFPSSIPDRKKSFPGVVKSNDINTQEIGRALSDLISGRFKGLKPYLLINHLGRSKIDVNRPMNEGTEVVRGVKNRDLINYTKKQNSGNTNASADVNYVNGFNEGFNQTFESETQIVWNDYHTFMKSAVEEIEERFNYGIVIDLHGHGHPENYIELGYVLSSEILALPTNELNSDPSIPSRSSIRALYTRMQSALNFVDLLRSEITSFGGKLQSYGYDTIPSYAHPYPEKNERYFHGGYIVQKYGSRHGEQVVDAIQIELPRKIRLGSKESRERFTTTLSDSVSWLLKEYYLRKSGNLNQAS